MKISEPHIRRRPALAVGIMAKAPIAGFAKTRLIPLLGASGAARLHAEMIEKTLQTCLGAAPGAVTLFVTGEGADQYWDECRRAFSVPVVEQRGHTLGDRMSDALCVLLQGASAALLVGTDCPALLVQHLHDAARTLSGRRMVFIPALDGGYVLVGATKRYPMAFSDIAWGTATVMAETRATLQGMGWRRGIEWLELDALADVDEPADYVEALRAGWLRPLRPQDHSLLHQEGAA